MMLNHKFLLAHLVLLLHGDMDQFERNKVINAFKRQEVPVLVATDVAGRMRSQLFYLQSHFHRLLVGSLQMLMGTLNN